MKANVSPSSWQHCHQAGMTAPEAASAMGRSDNAAYRWARSRGLKWASRKRGASKERMLELQTLAYNKRVAAIRAHFQKEEAKPVNGWTWAQLHASGFTGPEAARVRGMTSTAAYQWAQRKGKEWPRHHADPKRCPIAGLSPEDRAEYLRMKCYNLTGDERLRILGRADLVEGKMLGDPIEHMARKMRADAVRAQARIKVIEEHR